MKLPKNASSFFIIFIGDTHGYMDDFRMQKQVIEKVNPDYVLYEQMNNKKLVTKAEFMAMLKNKSVSTLTEVDEVRPLLKICIKNNLPLIGIDFKNFGISWAGRFKHKLDNQQSFTKKEKEELKRIYKIREKQQLRMIRQYAKKGKIVVITGAHHLRKNSPLIKGISHFMAILPHCNGEPAFGPVADKRKLKYGVITK
ncbi:MAG: hypothetical protein QME12_08525 [Nanoarchaeota archaeon]|nr:hypothetical protein [Nanoarchaeota archaeon]